MKRILALDTATRWGGLALIEQEGRGVSPVVVAELGIRVNETHAERLLPRIEHLLAEAGWEKDSVDAFVATRGPGSFTGIRVGLGTLRGLGLATGRPCFGVTSLEALAEAHGPAAEERVALIGAGRGEFYLARFDADGSPPAELEPPSVASEEQVVQGFTGAQVCLIPAAGTRFESSSPAALSQLRVARPPRGVAAAAGCLALLRAGGLDSPAPPLTPVYVRPPAVRIPRER